MYIICVYIKCNFNISLAILDGNSPMAKCGVEAVKNGPLQADEWTHSPGERAPLHASHEQRAVSIFIILFFCKASILPV